VFSSIFPRLTAGPPSDRHFAAIVLCDLLFREQGRWILPTTAPLEGFAQVLPIREGQNILRPIMAFRRFSPPREVLKNVSLPRAAPPPAAQTQRLWSRETENSFREGTPLRRGPPLPPFSFVLTKAISFSLKRRERSFLLISTVQKGSSPSPPPRIGESPDCFFPLAPSSTIPGSLRCSDFLRRSQFEILHRRLFPPFFPLTPCSRSFFSHGMESSFPFRRFQGKDFPSRRPPISDQVRLFFNRKTRSRAFSGCVTEGKRTKERRLGRVFPFPFSACERK